ncbi:hypothetical protein JTE90_019337 [Oedothorax gibbosus]|uniref:Probable ATP-dependent RNA helicase spindle-E n=1 Tax=Oedothorax gibbosus TaxID=931172 RepID=A0AAV6UKR8_9ARAC|nr:hypothetical protein JTE90_019337 [Oedothorax gibbosus]
MTTSNDITKDHIDAYLSLTGILQPLNIAPTATGGAGFNNRDEFKKPQSAVPRWASSGTEYVKKYLNKDNESQFSTSSIGVPAYSTSSLNTLLDVDDSSTAAGTVPALNELYSETTQNIYETYFNVPRAYDQDLTITKYREDILQQLNISPVVIIQGPTGCGKTTQVPQYILDYHQSRGTYCNIIVTQPRKIAAISIARRVCHERKWQLGTIVGYQVAMDAKTSTDTRLNYVTTGVLLEKLVNAKRMDMYTHVIIDEVHERNQDIDFALLLVKKFLNTNSQKVKVVLMSATFDSSEFADYFALSSRGDAAPIIDIIGKTKDVSEYYVTELKTLLSKGVPDYDLGRPCIDPSLYNGVLKLLVIFDKIEKDEQNVPKEVQFAPKRGAVLIFLPGYEEIAALSELLKTEMFSKNFWIIPLHSSITVEEQTKVFQNAPNDHRKIIISTNIAESSITVPDVKYVIDFCLTKNLVTDPATNYTCLQLEWASKANCIQRKGRAGRVDIGKVYRMVPRNFYDQLPEYGIPEIKRCPLTNTILHIKKLNLCDPQEMLAFALDPPDLSDIGSAVLQLKEALALTSKVGDPFDGDLTFIGRVMANLPLDIKLSKLIIFGYTFHCLEECIIIAASLSLQSFFAKPFHMDLDAYRSKLSWANGTFSDCLCHLNAFNMWKQLSIQGQFKRPGGLGEQNWAQKHFIQLRRIKEVDLLVTDIKKRLERLQFFVDQKNRFGNDESNIPIIKMVIAGAFFPYYFVQDQLDEKKINRDINENDPHSTVVVEGLPNYGILYAATIKDIFSRCSNVMNFVFEGSKAYILFPRNAASTTTVLHPVYLAVKMGKLRMPMELSVFSEEEAERKFKQLMATKQVANNKTLAPNRITVNFNKSEPIPRQPLPPLSKTTEVIFITHVVDCGHFWARYTSDNTILAYNYLETTIQQEKRRGLKPLPSRSSPQIDRLYLAPYYEGQNEADYYRAQLLDVRGERAKVFFVDYGNTEFIKVSELREINDESTPDVRKTEALAFECQLAEIKPSSIKSSKGDWSLAANSWFKANVNGLKLTAKIYSVVQGVIRIELFKRDQHGININLNKELIKKGFAEPSEENLLSRQNNEIRVKACDYFRFNESEYDNATRDDVEVVWKDAGECKQTACKARLKGPFSPLEVNYSGLTYLDSHKRVKVERDSVNSVSFNSDPQDSYTNMLVAAHVGAGRDSLQLMARNTTLMPKLRGLPSLVCLLFSPFVEFRTDEAKKSYIGALCGLGYDEKGYAIYADHDLEIAFDVKISREDISVINGIRMGFNILLNSDSDVLQYPSSSVSILHETTRKTIIDLLQKKREPKELEFFRKPYQWNQQSSRLLEPGGPVDADCPHILPLLKVPPLAEHTQAEKVKIKEHLKELYRIIQNEPHTKALRNIECQLCSFKIASTRELAVHLDSDKHMSKEDKFRQRGNY